MNYDWHSAGLPSFTAKCGRNIKDEAIRIQISMYKAQCSGEYLESIIRWLGTIGVGSVDLQISDTLQRHNFLWRGMPESISLKKALKAGQNWIRDNKENIAISSQLFDETIIRRWQHWVKNNKYKFALQKVISVYEADKFFQKILEREIENYFENITAEINTKNLILSKQFIIEEIAVSDVSAMLDRRIEIYPGRRFEPEQYLISNHPNLFHFNEADFCEIYF